MAGLRDARVFVTGADGFIGSHLVELLVEAGARVRALVYYNSWNAIGWLDDLPAGVLAEVELTTGDVRDPARMETCVGDCEYVFHLSSLIAIPYSYESPRSYVDTNVGGALNVLEACRRCSSLTRLVHVSTSEVYGSAQRVPIDEHHPIVTQSPYAASKAAADKIAESYQRSFDTPVVTARPFNTYGPRQTARAVIPTIAQQLLGGCDALQLGTITPTRDFNYCRDIAAGLIELAMCERAVGEVVNIGTGEEHSIEETARLLMQIVGREVPIQFDEQRLRPEGSEVDRLCADTSKMKELTGWSAAVGFEDGLRQTVDWMATRLDRFEPGRFDI